MVGTFTISDQRATAKAFRSWHRTRFPKKMQKQNEIKWSATGISDELRLRTIKHISDLNVRMRHIYQLMKKKYTFFAIGDH